MKVIVAVYTKTGNSAQVARMIAEKLRARSHEADVQLLKVKGELHPGVRRVEFERTPSVDTCDALVVGGPVWAFAPSPPLPAFIAGLGDSVRNKKTIVFVTHGLPFMFAGPRRALRMLSDGLRRRGARVAEGVAVWCWVRPSATRLSRGAEMVVERLCGLA